MILQILITVFALFAMSRIYIQWRKNHVGISAFFFWLIIWSGIVVFAYWPGLMSSISGFLGIGRGVDVFVYFGIMLLFYLSYRIYIHHEELNHKLNRVIKELALKDINRDES